MNKLIITHIPSRAGFIISAVFDGKRVIEIDSQNMVEKSILKNIYVGKVKNIVKNINAAFVEIEAGLECYYSLEENKKHIFLAGSKSPYDKLSCGDLILVQVVKENIKTKAPVVSSNISISGKYAVVSYGNATVGVSNKLNTRAKLRLKGLIENYCDENYGVVARTNAKDASDEEIIDEVKLLKERLKVIIEQALHRTCYSCLYKEAENYVGFLKTLNHNQLEEIVTDDKNIYDNIREYISNELKADINIRLYEDMLLPLYKLYNLEKVISDALSTRVWLKSGAYLIIEPTEAFTVIDVNTGKYSGNKKQQDTFLKINLEAAKEIAFQLRLRNISGIIVVDFIDMKQKEYVEKLMQEFREELKHDVVVTTLIGTSPLNLFELTRKKIRKSVREQLSIECPYCHGRGYLSI